METEIKTYYYPNGQILTKYNHIDDEKHGLFESWHPNGQIDERSNWKNGKLHGLFEWWYPDGQLAIRSNYVNGKLDGLFELWHPDGQLMERSNWLDGKRYGLCEEWYSDGQLMERSNWLDDKRHGLLWYQNGQTIKYYKNGKQCVIRVSGIKKAQRKWKFRFQKSRMLVLCRKLPIELGLMILGFVWADF